MKPMSRLIITILPFLCLFTAGPKAQAVVPPPDGGYPNFTTAEGQNALFSLTSGAANTAVGWSSLKSVTAGSFNTGVGAGTLLFNTADANTALGAAALLFNTTGINNTAVGATALLHNTNAEENTATGAFALSSNTTGANNTANGAFALFSNTTGFNNNAVGNSALEDNSTGSNNTALGDRAGGSVTTANDVICIGASVFGENVDNSCYIGNIWNQPGGTQAVYVNSEGKLGAQVSSRRFKDKIKPMEQTSEVIYGLRPVSFRYKPEIEPTRPLGFGLIAEEVEKISPELITRDEEGKPQTVRYEAVNAMLLNEFLKEHRKVEKLEATVAELASRLERASVQVQMNDSAAQVAAHNH
jgi:Chaperone of endosialidase